VGRRRPQGLCRLLCGLLLICFGPVAQAALFSSTLPASRSVQVDQTATAFATLIHSGTVSPQNCRIELATAIDADFFFQATDPASNLPIGDRDAAVDLPSGGSQSFVVGVTLGSVVSPVELAFTFVCDNDGPAVEVEGLNTLLFSASSEPVPDVVALSATVGNTGIVELPMDNGLGFFSVASVNVGSVGLMTVTGEATGGTTATILICQTDPASGVCLATVAESVTVEIAANATPTFAIFVASQEEVPFDPAGRRLFLRFTDEGGTTRGATSVALRGGGASSPPTAESVFTAEVGSPIVQGNCIACHVSGGLSGGTPLVFVTQGVDAGHLSTNLAVFSAYLDGDPGAASRILEKVQGGLSHGGGVRLGPTSAEFASLQSFLTLLASSLLPTAEEAFLETVSIPIVQGICIGCHVVDGLSGHTPIVFARAEGDAMHESTNLDVFRSYVAGDADAIDRILDKVQGLRSHGGGLQLAGGSTALADLAAFLALLGDEPTASAPEAFAVANLFEEVGMASPESTLARASLILTGAAPTAELQIRVRDGGEAELARAVRDLMQGPGFHQFLIEGANDRLLTDRYLNEDVLEQSDAKFVRHTNKLHSLRIEATATGDYRPLREWRALSAYGHARAPLELIAHVVEGDRPYTEVLTADYLMVNFWSAEALGSLASFGSGTDVDDFVPSTIGRYYRDGAGKKVRFVDFDVGVVVDDPGPLATVYPHAGVLNTPVFLRRYPSTDTNRNRARARWTLYHFLGEDVENRAVRTTDPVALADQDNPTLKNSHCTVCHSTLDPVAGAFQNYGDTGLYKDQRGGADSLPGAYKRAAGDDYRFGDSWYHDMRFPGFEGDLIDDPNASLQWLASRIAGDRRFGDAAVRFWWPALMGGEMLSSGGEPGDFTFAARTLAFGAQQETMKRLAAEFTAPESDFKLKDLLVGLVMSPWFRAHEVAVGDDLRLAALDDAGTDKLLTPSQLSRKTRSVTGFEWGAWPRGTVRQIQGALDSDFRLYYGGIDSDGVVVRASDMTAVMAGVAEAHATEAACPIVYKEFLLADGRRRLFNGVDRSVTPILEFRDRFDVMAGGFGDRQSFEISGELERGERNVVLRFDNDYYVAADGVDRNLVVDMLRVYDSSGGLVQQIEYERADDPLSLIDAECGSSRLDSGAEGADDVFVLWSSCNVSVPIELPRADEYRFEVTAYGDQAGADNVIMSVWVNAPVGDLQNSRGAMRIREKLAELHQQMLSEEVSADSPEVDHTFELLTETWLARRELGNPQWYPGGMSCSWFSDFNFFDGLSLEDPYIERGDGGYRWDFDKTGRWFESQDLGDADFMLQTWRVVIAYLMSDYKYLYI
jgi:hypothetical protein